MGIKALLVQRVALAWQNGNALIFAEGLVKLGHSLDWREREDLVELLFLLLELAEALVISVSLIDPLLIQIPINVIECFGGQHWLTSELTCFCLADCAHWNILLVVVIGQFQGDLLLDTLHDVVAVSDDAVHAGGTLLAGVDAGQVALAVLGIKVRSHAKSKVFVIFDCLWDSALSLFGDFSIVHNFHHLSLTFHVAILLMGRFGRSWSLALKLLKIESLQVGLEVAIGICLEGLEALVVEAHALGKPLLVILRVKWVYVSSLFLWEATELFIV